VPGTSPNRVGRLLATALLLGACDGPPPPPDDGRDAPTTTTPPRAEPLRDAAQLEAFLRGYVWRIADDPLAQFWYFADQDDMFKVWVTGDKRVADVHTVLPDWFPPGTLLVGGSWSVTMDELSLADMSGPDIVSLPPVTLPIRWLGGGDEIEIGGHTYRREQDGRTAGDDA
jgi:hypothetical protein